MHARPVANVLFTATTRLGMTSLEPTIDRLQSYDHLSIAGLLFT